MKHKLIALLCLFCIGLTAIAQSEQQASELGYTIFPDSLYNTIKFEDVLFSDIKATHGDINQMANLFPLEDDGNSGPTTGIDLAQPNSVTIEEPGAITGNIYREFEYHNGLEVTFFGENQGDELEVIDLKSDNITINGVKLEIGDPISNLTSVNYLIKNGANNNKLVKVVQEGEYAVSLSLRLDSNNILSEIHYYVNP